MKYLFPLTAIHIDGHTLVIDTVEGFNDFARRNNIGERHRFRDFVYDRMTRSYDYRECTNDWIVRDDAGRVVLMHTFTPLRSTNWKKRCRNRRGNFDFRDGPVPGVRRGWKRKSMTPRKRHGGRGVAARIALLHSQDPWDEVE